MERIELPLSKLTLAQKLDLMEAIWDDLAKHEETLESPDWHEQVLKDREEALAAGKTIVFDWKEAKERIKRNASCESVSISRDCTWLAKCYHDLAWCPWNFAQGVSFNRPELVPLA